MEAIIIGFIWYYGYQILEQLLITNKELKILNGTESKTELHQ